MPDAGMIDIHSHILPGLDDGARDIEEAIRMCSIAADDGITEIVATPHHLDEAYHNPKSKVADAVASLNEALCKQQVGIKVHPGSDLRLGTSLLEELKADKIMTVNDTGKFILLELPSFFMPHHVKDLVFKLKLIGITPVITHPERNKTAMEETDFLYELVLAGALLQITANSITGEFGGTVETRARWLIEHRMAHIVATDAHNPSARPPRLSKAFNILSEIAGSEEARMTVIDRPASVIAGDMPQISKPIRPKKKSTILSFLGLERRDW